MIIKIKNTRYFKTVMFFVYEGIYLLFIDAFNQYLLTRSFDISNYLINNLVVFNIVWILLFFIFLYVLKPKARKVIACIFNILLLLISLANYFMYSYFYSVFSWKDLVLSGDGFSFIDSVFKFINLKIILFTLTSIDMILLVYKTRTKRTYKFKSIQSLILVIMIIVLFGVRRIYINNNLNSVNDGWNSNNVISNDSNYYQNWNSPTRLIKICGIYEYLIKDFYNSFIKKDNGIEARLFVNNYIDENYKEDNNEYTGIFKDKNLIFVMMESMDDWLVNENVTPTMYMMMQHGFNFNNHYSPGYVTGDTANTEFIANTGMYPVINKLSPNYAYVNNSYPYSIANLFKNEGYTVNSFHRSGGGIYNRENMHISLGYEKYHNYVDMGISDDNLDLDSYIIKDGYDKIISDNKFMSFIITYSPHSPYTYNKIECQTNLSDIKTIYPELDNEELLCAYSAARETDNMFKLLLEKLKNDNLLDDTIIVAFTDHPNKLVIRDDETEKLNKTIFYIYDHEMNSNQIDTITSSINILPTVINLFGIKNNYLYSGYDALDTNEEYVIFKDYTYFDGKEVKTVTKEYKDKLEYSSDILSSDYYKDNTVKK